MLPSLLQYQLHALLEADIPKPHRYANPSLQELLRRVDHARHLSRTSQPRTLDSLMGSSQSGSQDDGARSIHEQIPPHDSAGRPSLGCPVSRADGDGSADLARRAGFEDNVPAQYSCFEYHASFCYASPRRRYPSRSSAHAKLTAPRCGEEDSLLARYTSSFFRSESLWSCFSRPDLSLPVASWHREFSCELIHLGQEFGQESA